MPPRSRAPKAPTADVTAVLVACDGARWLPQSLAALAASTVRPSAVVCVDTGSTDASAELMTAAYDVVHAMPRGTGFGAAVQTALEAAAPTSWIWLLHDDAAPEPDALEALLAYAAESPSAALLGPKVRDWDDPRVLVEVGLTTDPAGHRETGLDRREHDQGQHDAIRDVLAVGTAGALIRRDVWDEVGGLDPLLPVFRDDLDLGWRVNAAGHRVVVVPSARLRHARAATTGRRELPAAAGRPAGIDRRNALFVLLAHAAGFRLLGTLPRLVVACLLRAVGFLLTRQVLAARDELGALLSVVGRPGRLLKARRARARTRTVSPRAVRPLLARRSGRARARFEELADWMSGGSAPGATPLLGDPGPEGPDDLADLAPAGGGTAKRLLLEPGVVLTLTLALVALLAERDVLSLRGGTLLGGRLLPVPAGAHDLWSAYVSAWHPTALGSAASASPSVGVLALLSTVLGGKPWLAVDVLLLASVPIAGAVAYAVSGRLTAHRLLRLWAAATWALLPVATGAIADGRVDAAVVQISLPALAAGAAGLLRGSRNGWGLGLGLAVASAFAPLLWPLVGGLVVIAALLTGSVRRILAAAVVAVVPALVLFPWSLHPVGLLDGPGRLLDTGPHAAWRLVLLNPGGVAIWVTGGLLLAGLGGLLRRDAHRVALALWGTALVGLVAAAALDREGHWPGIALQLAGLGIVGAALVGANGLRTRLAQASFGWRQLTAVLVVVAAAIGPAAMAASWISRGADGPLQRRTEPVLPAFARAELAATPGLRVLVVRPEGATVVYELTASGGDRFGSADTAPTAEQASRLDGVVADLLAARGSDAAEALATRAVRYVAVPAGRDSGRVAAALDVQAGLSRRASGAVLLWRVVAPAARLTLLPPATAAAALRGDRGPSRELLRTAPPLPQPAGREAARLTAPRGRAGRLLVLAEAFSPGWHATIDGTELPKKTAWGWAQGFVLPAAGGRVHIRYDQGPRHRALAAQGLAVGLVLVLAAPATRRRRGLEVVDDEPDLEPARELQGALR